MAADNNSDIQWLPGLIYGAANPALLIGALQPQNAISPGQIAGAYVDVAKSWFTSLVPWGMLAVGGVLLFVMLENKR